MALFDLPKKDFKYTVTNVQYELNSFLKMLFSAFSNPQTLTLKYEDGSPAKGDYSVRLFDPLINSPTLQEIIKEFETRFSEHFNNCYIHPLSKIVIKLNRTPIYSSVLREVLTNANKYGHNNIGQNVNVLFIRHSYNTSSLIDMRTYLVTQHMALILIANGYNVYFPKMTILPDENCVSDFTIYDCSENCNLTDILHSKISLALKSNWLVDLKNNEVDSECINQLEADEVVLDGKRFIMESEENLFKHYKNIGYLFLKSDGHITNCMEESVRISHIIANHGDNTDLIIHVAPENKACSIQKAGLLVNMLDNMIPKQYYLIHQGIFKNDCAIDITDFIQRKRKDIESSLIHKYGPEIVEDSNWKSCIENLTNTEISFEFLFSRSSLPLKINSNPIKSELNEKGGTFVQYNCARLAMLFKHFNEQVKHNYYNPLSNLDEIDFSQLKLEEEWNLIYNYILPFPSLIKDLVEQFLNDKSITLEVSTHKVTQMLVKLSRDLSIYYNKIRILVDPQPHLQKKMFARLYLLKGVHQVMKCALALLNLSAVDRM